MVPVVIDRIEGDIAVVEVAKGEFVGVPLASIDGDARDGAVLARNAGGYYVDEKATSARRMRLDRRRHSLFGRE
ncbi:MAG: DUF3006 domain-containing protein [Collinsella phocaeensis]